MNVNEHTKICGEHFVIEDYVNRYSVKKTLKDDAVPSIFAWNKDKNQSKKRRSVTEKLGAIKTEEDEATDTASEGEGDHIKSSSGKGLGLVYEKHKHMRMTCALRQMIIGAFPAHINFL